MKLPLGSSGQAKVESCEARKIRLNAEGAKDAKFKPCVATGTVVGPPPSI